MSPKVIDMTDSQLHTVAQLRALLDGSLAMKFSPPGNDVERYGFITAVLKRLHVRRLERSDKGVVRRYLCWDDEGCLPGSVASQLSANDEHSEDSRNRSQMTAMVREALEVPVPWHFYACSWDIPGGGLRPFSFN